MRNKENHKQCKNLQSLSFFARCACPRHELMPALTLKGKARRYLKFIDGSASSLCHELLHQYGEYGRYESLDPLMLNRFKYTECRSPLIVPVMFSKEHLEMMKLTQSCINKNILKIHPSMDEVIVSLKSAKNKPNNPYSLDKNTSAHHDTLDALRLALSCMKERRM